MSIKPDRREALPTPWRMALIKRPRTSPGHGPQPGDQKTHARPRTRLGALPGNEWGQVFDFEFKNQKPDALVLLLGVESNYANTWLITKLIQQ